MALAQFQRRRKLALAGLIALALVSLCVVGSAWGEQVHEEIEMIGLGLIVVGIVGRMWCTLYIGGRKAAEIVTDGPYSVSRNPLYVFSTIAAGGAGAATGSILLGLLFMLGCAVAFQIVIRREENFLLEAFGTDYRTYLARVPRFLPKLALYQDVRVLTVDTTLIYRTLVDGLVFFAAMPFFETVEYMQAGGYLPIILRLY